MFQFVASFLGFWLYPILWIQTINTNFAYYLQNQNIVALNSFDIDENKNTEKEWIIKKEEDDSSISIIVGTKSNISSLDIKKNTKKDIKKNNKIETKSIDLRKENSYYTYNVDAHYETLSEEEKEDGLNNFVALLDTLWMWWEFN